VNEYFRDRDKGDNVLDKQEEARASIQIGYRAVLDSKSSDETLVSNSPLPLFPLYMATFFSLKIIVVFFWRFSQDYWWYARIMIPWTLLTKCPGTLCKLGAKTLNALLQLPMAKVCEAWVRAQALCIHGCRTSWVSGIWDSGTAKPQLFYLLSHITLHIGSKLKPPE
jgi:hypothetical protein